MPSGTTDSVSTIVFDVNETLSDLGALGARFAAVGASPDLAPLWFTSVLRDGMALTAAGDSQPFAEIASTLLTSLVDPASLDRPTGDAVAHIMAGFMGLSVHPDVPPGIAALRANGLRLVTLSNGSSAVADELLRAADLRDSFESLLTVEDSGLWKPARTAYEYAGRECGVDLSQMMLVAVHPWDIHGAARAGMNTAWINRRGATYPGHFFSPDVEVSGLDELATRLV
ncbi:MAG: haloacid dehalogenase type II [Ornithinimicrobium sp.]